MSIDDQLNIILVGENGRDTVLVDPSEINQQLVNHYHLFIVEYGNMWLVSRQPITYPESEEELGYRLGYVCAGNDYANIEDRRVLIYIEDPNTRVRLTTEVCNRRLLSDARIRRSYHQAQQNTRIWNQIMTRLNFPYRFRAYLEYDDGTIYRFEHLLDTPYFQSHLKDYLNDLVGRYFENSIFIQHPEEIPRYWILFKYLYRLINTRRFRYNIPNFNQLMSELEYRLIEADPSEYDTIIQQSGLLET